MPHRPVAPVKRGLAKAMRRNMTVSELTLWRHLRKPGIEGLRFRRQVPIGPYIVDFFCPQHRLIVEVDGDSHGYHASMARDAVRDEWLAEHGYRVVRIWNGDVADDIDGVCRAIVDAVDGANQR